MKVLITGGTGTVGVALAQLLHSENEVTVFSRNEDVQKQNTSFVNCIPGDVRNYNECLRASIGMDAVYHLAAMKHVNTCEQFPQEATETNILGAMNIVNACLRNSVKRMVHLSTDKVIDPSNTYGATKLVAEKIVLNAGFTVVRSGNVLGSSNSIVPILKKQISEFNSVRITDGEMTRFYILLPDLIEYLISAEGLFIPEMKAFRLIDLARAMFYKYGQDNFVCEQTGIGKGEKMHEWIDEKRCSKDYVVPSTEYINEL